MSLTNGDSPKDSALVKPEPATPKFMFPDLGNNPGGMMVNDQDKTFWVGINMKVADFNEASCILDGAKLTALNAYKLANQKRIIAPGNALQSMKSFVANRFK